MKKLVHLVPLAVTVLATGSLASTYVVDAAGGGDFTTIIAAVAAAVPGDVLIVRPGNYAAFTLDEGISILGTTGVLVSGNVIVGPLPLGPRATLQGLRLDELDIHDCLAPVTVVEVTMAPGINSLGNIASVDVRDSRDVRLRAVTSVPGIFDVGWHGLHVESSRVELTHSHFRGRTSPYVDWGHASGGYDALFVEGSSVVHVSLSTLEGGVGGGAGDGGGIPTYGGDGGAGIRVHDDARVLLTGRASDVVRGGQGGYAVDCMHDGHPSSGVVNLAPSSVRHSGVTVLGAVTYLDCGSFPAAAFVGPHVLAVPLDPSLQLGGTGSSVTFTLRGEPGDSARLRLGRQLALVDLPDVIEDRLLVPLRTYDLGTLPASGEATFSMTLSGAWPAGFQVVAQGSCNTGGVTRLSQSVPIVLR